MDEVVEKVKLELGCGYMQALNYVNKYGESLL